MSYTNPTHAHTSTKVYACSYMCVCMRTQAQTNRARNNQSVFPLSHSENTRYRGHHRGNRMVVQRSKLSRFARQCSVAMGRLIRAIIIPAAVDATRNAHSHTHKRARQVRNMCVFIVVGDNREHTSEQSASVICELSLRKCKRIRSSA